MITRFEPSTFDEDSQSGCSSSSSLAWEPAVRASARSLTVGPRAPKSPRYARSRLRRHRAGTLGFAAALAFSLIAQESHTAGEPDPPGKERRHAQEDTQQTIDPRTPGNPHEPKDAHAVDDPREPQDPEDPDRTLNQRWRKNDVTVALDASLMALGPDIQHLIENAFATWENTGAALPNIELIHTTGKVASLKPDGQSTILIAPIEFPGHESDLAITIGFSHPSTGEISEADIVINSKHIFSSVTHSETLQSGRFMGSEAAPEDQESCAGSLDSRACSQSYDLANVLTHEVGHFFGLGENYNEPRTTMFSCTSACEIHKRDLEPADMDSIILLYTDEPTVAAAGCSVVKFTATTTPQNFGLWGTGLALFGVSFWRRRSGAEL